MRYLLAILLILVPSVAWCDATHTVNCSDAAVTQGISDATAGDTVLVNSGSCQITVTVDKGITLKGGNGGTTTLTSGTSVLVTSTNARITGFTFNDASTASIAVGAYGVLIDNNSFVTTSSGNEIIQVYGATDSWSTDHSMGGANNVFIENNTFSAGGGSAQCAQGNYNARIVFRYNTCTGCKFDMHGIWSNGSPANYCNWDDSADAGYTSDAHSARHAEVYNNNWVAGATNGCMELRGGTAYVYNNTMAVSDWANGITIREYCATYAGDGNCCGTLCPSTYPWRDQPGRGKNQALEPMYFWNNTGDGGTQIGGFNPGASDPSYIIHFEHMLSTGRVTACGQVASSTSVVDGETVYVSGWNGGGDTLCDMTGIVQENRDYYVSTSKPSALSAYAPYQCPHPLATDKTGVCKQGTAGTGGYNQATGNIIGQGIGTVLKFLGVKKESIKKITGYEY